MALKRDRSDRPSFGPSTLAPITCRGVFYLPDPHRRTEARNQRVVLADLRTPFGILPPQVDFLPALTWILLVGNPVFSPVLVKPEAHTLHQSKGPRIVAGADENYRALPSRPPKISFAPKPASTRPRFRFWMVKCFYGAGVSL